MTISTAGLARILAAAAAAVAFSAAARSQEPLALAKASYAEASYEEALKLLEPLHTPEANQYRALCLLALGRTDEATRAVERLVEADPLFAPSAEEMPPRFLALVSEVKRKILPAAAVRTFSAGRDAFNAKAYEKALQEFDLVLKLTAEPLFKDSPDAKDLRTLALGFADLARASAQAQAPAPAPDAEGATRVLPAAPPEVTQPVAISQEIPPLPPNLTGALPPVTSIRVFIGTDGRVTSAEIVRSSHPIYDRLLLAAARGWTYKPGTMNGRPVPTEKVVTVELRR